MVFALLKTSALNHGNTHSNYSTYISCFLAFVGQYVLRSLLLGGFPDRFLWDIELENAGKYVVNLFTENYALRPAHEADPSTERGVHRVSGSNPRFVRVLGFQQNYFPSLRYLRDAFDSSNLEQ